MASRRPDDSASHEAQIAVSAKHVAALFDFSESTWHRMTAAAKTPSPIRLGGSVRWRLRELTDWANAGCPPRDKRDEMNNA